MSEASIRCQWCNLEQHCHNSDFTCGINTRGRGHKWWPGEYSVDKDAEISRLRDLLKECHHWLGQLNNPERSTITALVEIKNLLAKIEKEMP